LRPFLPRAGERASNCQGDGTLRIYEGGVLVSELALNMVVSGSPENPLVHMLISNPAEQFTGLGVLTRIAF
jgi:hypothetical protein